MPWKGLFRYAAIALTAAALAGCLHFSGYKKCGNTENYSIPRVSKAPELRRGMNLGNALEAPAEGNWGVVLQKDYFRLIKEAGFDTVRIPIRWSAHAGHRPPYTIDACFLDRVDWAVISALERNMNVVINIHHYDEFIDRPGSQKNRFLSLWGQIAEHYRDFPDQVIFELLNEPEDGFTSIEWNEYLNEAIRIIRKSNPERKIMVAPAGPTRENISALESLSLPIDDQNVIVTFHYYQPFRFTHQGAGWVHRSSDWLGTEWQGEDSEKEAIRREFDQAKAWAERNQRRLWLGEFGTYYRGEMDSRIRWTEFVAREAEARGFGWAYWGFGAGFGVFDTKSGSWEPGLLKALIPES